MKKIVYGLLLFSAIGCGSVENYTQNDLRQEFFQEKMMVFTLSSASVKYINVTGPHSGYPSNPDVNEVFKQAVAELAEETHLNLKTADHISQASIDVKILDIDWHFGLSRTDMITKLNFNTNGKNYESTGHFKNFGGSAGNNLKRSFKNAIYNFLLTYQK
ncbi:hypothetical protein [Chryseobacterium gambrini]|uniref:hypothetical protein n=1 Tax=Chryseobacterium gambrini TaxID=373672 RepID=UPI0022F15D18|nr:hypothetical protein [Chryseobacterium gambrini]WBV53112.1 hypothetical protein PFY09_02095 [Chryseobacterium gambrini]